MAVACSATTCLLLLIIAPCILACQHAVQHGRRLAASDAAHGLGLKTINDNYTPDRIDWAGVISACRGIGQYERRLHSFNIRAAFHDGLGVNAALQQGGMDGSIFTHAEMLVSKNEGFTAGSWRAVRTVAMKYGTSMADALAVCGAVGVQELSSGRTKIIGPIGLRNFPVGRLDSAAPTGEFADGYSDQANVDEFGSFWTRMGFTIEEAVSLMGAHSLFDNLGCSRSSVPGDVCDPDTQSCINQVRMFKWDVHFYHNACTGTINFVQPRAGPFDDALMNEMRKQTMCGYTSQEYRNKRMNTLIQEQQSGRTGDAVSVLWSNDNCMNSRAFGANNACPHDTFWPYTVNDAHLGLACQGLEGGQFGQQVQDAMRKFLDQKAWDEVFSRAYIKMVSQFATWVDDAPLMINGLECRRGYVIDTACAKSNKLKKPNAKALCSACTTRSLGGSKQCHKCCKCASVWTSKDKLLPELEPFVTPSVFEI